MIKKGINSPPIIIAIMEKIFSPTVLGATLPNPILVRVVIVKYMAVIYLEWISGPLVVSFGRYGVCICTVKRISLLSPT